MIHITLAGPPKGKGRPRFSRVSGHTYTPAATVSYESALRYAGYQAMEGRPPIEGALSIGIFAFIPVPKSWNKTRTCAALAGELRPTSKPDGDNLAKMVDALNEVVWRDDSQIVDWSIRKFYSDRPRLEVTVSPVLPDFLQ